MNLGAQGGNLGLQHLDSLARRRGIGLHRLELVAVDGIGTADELPRPPPGESARALLLWYVALTPHEWLLEGFMEDMADYVVRLIRGLLDACERGEGEAPPHVSHTLAFLNALLQAHVASRADRCADPCTSPAYDSPPDLSFEACEIAPRVEAVLRR